MELCIVLSNSWIRWLCTTLQCKIINGNLVIISLELWYTYFDLLVYKKLMLGPMNAPLKATENNKRNNFLYIALYENLEL